MLGGAMGSSRGPPAPPPYERTRSTPSDGYAAAEDSLRGRGDYETPGTVGRLARWVAGTLAHAAASACASWVHCPAFACSSEFQHGITLLIPPLYGTESKQWYRSPSAALWS